MSSFIRLLRLRAGKRASSSLVDRPHLYYRGKNHEIPVVGSRCRVLPSSPRMRNRTSLECAQRNATRNFATTTANNNSAATASATANDHETEPGSEAHDSSTEPLFSNVIRGHDEELEFSEGIANMTDSTVLGRCGKTVALTTVVVAPSYSRANARYSNLRMVRAAIERRCRLDNLSQMVTLTVDYRQRHHAVGKIPPSAKRKDNQQPSVSEILASRAIDRALRPLLRKEIDGGRCRSSSDSSSSNEMPSIHLSCSIQAYPINDKTEGSITLGGHPISLALNSASVALNDRLVERVAAVVLCLMEDGSILVNPSISTIHCQQQKSNSQIENNGIMGELLYAGTKESVVMIEFNGILPESRLVQLIRFAHDSIQPVLDMQERISRRQESEIYQDDNELRKELGLPLETDDLELAESISSRHTRESEHRINADRIYEKVNQFVNSNLRDTVLRLFDTKAQGAEVDHSTKHREIKIHSEETDGPLLGKVIRGRKENIVKSEIKRLLFQFDIYRKRSRTLQRRRRRQRQKRKERRQKKRQGRKKLRQKRYEPSDSQLAQEYHMLQQSEPFITTLVDTIHSRMLREAMADASIAKNCRSDGRGGEFSAGSDTIRPLSMKVPALPDVVHGSAIFTRGETQVLCTTTLGPPRDGILQNDPYEPVTETLGKATDSDAPSKTLPVGSLRYLRSQEHLESDLNSRKVLADREQTGDSGTLKERRRAFLQYDFPAYCTGFIPTGPASASRREIGHGALAEKAILPILPPANEFPYAIRMTSEVTSSNGSSSMASVCGVMLSLLDAGVPIMAPVAGVSVGLVKDSTNEKHKLLLDISGTEDHYGLMDFKVAGTAEEVTALQLDVKQPISLSIVADALQLAKEGRKAILEEMKIQTFSSSDGAIIDLSPRPELKSSAPRSSVVKFDPARKKDLLGPGGVVIRQMEHRFNVSLDLTQEGQCLLFGDDNEMVRKAKAAVMDLVSDVEVGETYEGTIIEIRDFGVIIELLRNKEGLCHVSELADREEIRKHPGGTKGLVTNRFSIGQKVDVVCTAVDPVQGTIRLRPASKKEAF